jgi:hypothetical protein
MDIEFPKRRLFLSDGNNFYHVLSFTQSRSDSSIYVSSPDFSKVKWLIVTNKNGNLELAVTDSPGDGKLSVHGSGMTKITPNVHDLVVHGNYLLDTTKNAAGVRHLFTIQLAKPKFVPFSPAFNRESDYVISTKQLTPIIIIFFAIPRVKKLTVNYQVSFHIDDLDSIPPEGGGGAFELLLHNVFWYAYRTKHMDEWPQNPYICYHDGHLVPVLIGAGEKQFRAEFRIPTYELSNTELALRM